MFNKLRIIGEENRKPSNLKKFEGNQNKDNKEKNVQIKKKIKKNKNSDINSRISNNLQGFSLKFPKNDFSWNKDQSLE